MSEEWNNWNKLIELLQKEEPEQKVNAIKLLPKIINTQNAEKFITDLIPFITNMIDEEDDSCLLELLGVLPSLIPFPGNKQNIIKLLSFVEIGLYSSNNKIRQEAGNAYKLILKECLNFIKDFDPNDLVNKLCSSVSQKSRLAYLTIIPYAFKYLNTNHKIKASNFLKQFSTEGNDFVKKTLSSLLKDISFFISEDVLTNITNNLLENPNESIRIPIMSCISNLKYHQNLNLLQNYIQQVIIIIGKDESWRVRYTLAQSLTEILSFSILSPNLKKEVIRLYLTLLTDKDQEIRQICIKRLASSLEKIKDDEENINLLLDAFDNLAKNEQSFYVKEVIAENIVFISKWISKAKIKSIIVPIIYDLLDTHNKLQEPLLESSTIKSNDSLKSPSLDKIKSLQSVSPSMTKKSISSVKKSGSNLEKITGKKDSSLVHDNSGICLSSINVELKIIKSIPNLLKYYSHDFEAAVIKSITQIYNTSRWKNKVKLLEVILETVAYFSKASLVGDIFNILANKGLYENIYIIRELACKCVIEILIKTQDEATEKKVYQFLDKNKTNPSFHIRNLCVIFIKNYVKNKNHNENFIHSFLLPLVSDTFSKDKVANIRFNCSRIFQILYQKKAFSAKIKQNILDLGKDIDEEVRNSITMVSIV